MKINTYPAAIGAFIKLLAFVGIPLLMVTSCGQAKDAMPTQQQRRLNDKEAQELLFSKDTIPFWFFSAKIGVDYSSTKRSSSFNATVKMRVDSAFSGTLSVATLIGGTYLVNMDSVNFTNKQEKCFVKENFSALSQMFGTEIEYSFFQSLILGLPVGLDAEIKYKHKNTREYYILSSDKKKKDQRQGHDKDAHGPKDKDDPEDKIFVQYYVNTETWHLDRISIQVPFDNVEIDIHYLNRQAYADLYLPEQTTISIIHPQDSISISLDYGNVKLNERKEIDINIPETYIQCPSNL